MSTTRTNFLLALTATAAAFALTPGLGRAARGSTTGYAVSYSDDQWRKRLSPEAYDVLRNAGTEPAFSSPLDHETRAGRYACAGCALAVFDAKTKFDSGTGWPSFFKPLAHAVATSTDRSLLETRVEVHCRRCGGHLGHVFDDGPPPTGLRYCMNGVALTFRPAH
jgi:peptide-methionine (R)-S-oxide reductase